MTAQDTQIALLKQSMDFQQKEISEIKGILLDFIDSAKKTFTTKEEHEQTKKELKEMKDSKDWITKSALGLLFTIIGGGCILILKKLGLL